MGDVNSAEKRNLFEFLSAGAGGADNGMEVIFGTEPLRLGSRKRQDFLQLCVYMRISMKKQRRLPFEKHELE